jgi:hypothetical protein
VSKKNRLRRGAPASRAPASSAPVGKAPIGKAPEKGAPADGAGERNDTEEALQRAVSKLLGTISAGNPLEAELHTAMIMGTWHAMRTANPDDVDAFVFGMLVEGAARSRTPEAAALLRLVIALGSPAIKRAAGETLERLTAAGIYPPEWVTEIGKAVPLEAWRRYDVFGDHEIIGATFRYGDTDHGIAVRVDLTAIPVATLVWVTPDPADLTQIMTQKDDPVLRVERISLAEARRRLADPLARLDENPDEGASVDNLMFLPMVRSRVRRLPADDGGYHAPAFTAADRAAAVDDFLHSPQAAEAVADDEDATRFWAEVLTGYSSRIPGEPPGQVGPGKLSAILEGHVPPTFILSPTQRRLTEPAVTAWLHWSAVHRGLDKAAIARLMESLPASLARFEKAYDDPDAALARTYVTDLVTSDADVSWLVGHFARRMFAVPLPEPGEPDRPVSIGDAETRRALVRAEFTGCIPPDGMTGEEFLAAADRVVAELWDNDPPETFAVARHMSDAGTGRHDIIHRLAARKAAPATR